MAAWNLVCEKQVCLRGLHLLSQCLLMQIVHAHAWKPYAAKRSRHMNYFQAHHHGMHCEYQVLQCQQSFPGASMDCRQQDSIVTLDFLLNHAHREASIYKTSQNVLHYC